MRPRSHARGGEDQGGGRKKALQLVGGLPEALQKSSAKRVGAQREGQTQLAQGTMNVMKSGRENSQGASLMQKEFTII